MGGVKFSTTEARSHRGKCREIFSKQIKRFANKISVISSVSLCLRGKFFWSVLIFQQEMQVTFNIWPFVFYNAVDNGIANGSIATMAMIAQDPI